VPKDAINIIITQTIKLLNCDRVSLFVFDRRINMLVLNASNLTVPIRVQPGQGIAGHVFTSQETVNIPDCYSDARFDQSFDKATGYHTKCLLTMPIVDFEGETMGVLQAINKKQDEFSSVPHFTHIDEILIDNLTQHVSIALRNAEIYRAAIVTQERANALLQMIQSLSQDLGAQSTILTITMHAGLLVQADRCTVFLVDEGKQQIWSVATDSGKEIRMPKSAGIAGECACDANLINIPDCYEDPRFNSAFDKKNRLQNNEHARCANFEKEAM
jgi:adenylate cyclase